MHPSVRGVEQLCIHEIKMARAKRIKRGHYLYKGYHIYCIGYHAPDKKVVWEAADENECGFAHSYSLRETKALIDNCLENKWD